EEKVATWARVIQDFAMDDWRAIHPGRGTLVDFVRPKDL
ncbi:MAG: histidine phosphatase family protein, partial [Alphaproteobacteria bacterium]|nr:histidine phosphatase family protein [Alphaproteobacteria bacterium]